MESQKASASRSRATGELPDANTLRILISTDNHAGYAEDDSIRKEDSFRSLEEVFRIAIDCRVSIDACV